MSGWDIFSRALWDFFRIFAAENIYKKMPLKRYIALILCLFASIASSAQLAETEIFLIVSRPQFREGLKPFVQWKRQEGFDVVELYADTNRCFLVKEMICSQWPVSEGRWPEYTLLVGDHEQLEAFRGSMSFYGESHFTDLPYSDFTDDHLPETLLGRWPVNDTAELRTVVEKTLRYEQFLDMDTLQLRRVLLVAGREYGEPAPTTTNGQVNYLKREIKLAHPDIDTLCWYNPDSDNQGTDIASAIGQGACLLNYTGHGLFNRWDHPTMTVNMIADAGMTQPTVWVNNCCQSNAFTGIGFGECLLRMPVGGAVGVIGATNSTLWAEDYYWAVGPKSPFSLDPAYDSTALGAFDGLIGRYRTTATLGQLLYNGNMAVTAFGSSYTNYYWDIYCLFGDPSLKPWIGVPQEIDLEVDSVYSGQHVVNIAGTPGVRVTAVQDTELLGVATIDSLGQATIALRHALDSHPLLVTATGVDLVPHVVILATDTTVGINESENRLSEIDIFPNPANCDITVRVGRPATLTFLDLQGRSIIPSTHVNSSFCISHSSLRPGIYFIIVTTDKNSVSRKIIIR